MSFIASGLAVHMQNSVIQVGLLVASMLKRWLGDQLGLLLL